jgi:ribosome biogenesis protein ERB1
VGYHPHYPLFASCSDDGTVQIFHGMVYSDLMQNPLIVPVKILRGHEITDDLGTAYHVPHAQKRVCARARRKFASSGPPSFFYFSSLLRHVCICNLQLAGVLDCVFHPTEPWIFSAGADATIRLFI